MMSLKKIFICVSIVFCVVSGSAYAKQTQPNLFTHEEISDLKEVEIMHRTPQASLLETKAGEVDSLMIDLIIYGSLFLAYAIY